MHENAFIMNMCELSYNSVIPKLIIKASIKWNFERQNFNRRLEIISLLVPKETKIYLSDPLAGSRDG